MKCFLKEDSLIACIAAWKLGSSSVAIVIGKTVHLYNTTRIDFLANKRWVRHELAHIDQFARYGRVKFVFLYILESIRNGYHNNRFEVEARSCEDDFDLEKKYVIEERSV